MKSIMQHTLGLARKSGTSVLLTSTSRPAGLPLHYSTASTEAKPERLSKNLSFRPAYDSAHGQATRPLVLLYGWLVAKSKHIHKYGDFYLQKGFDVLHVKINPTQLMRPTNAQQVVQQVVDFTQAPGRQRQPVLVHGFSVGAYLYGETLVRILADPKVTENLSTRLRGQILDSPVDFDRIPLGVSRAVTPIPALQMTLQATLNGYLRLMKNYTVKHYTRSSDTFKENPFRAPTLFMYSKADVIGVPGPIEQIGRDYTSRGIDTYNKCFEDSVHVSHFMSYPVEYITALNGFLAEIGLVAGQESLEEKLSVQQ